MVGGEIVMPKKSYKVVNAFKGITTKRLKAVAKDAVARAKEKFEQDVQDFFFDPVDTKPTKE